MFNFRLSDVLGEEVTAHSQPTVPKVSASYISDTARDGIYVLWDRPMSMTCDAKDQINIIIDGSAPVHPTSIVFNTDQREMGLLMPTPFIMGQVVTWAYDDQGACDLQEVDPPNTEADNQTYGVANRIVALSADSTLISADATTHTADEG